MEDCVSASQEKEPGLAPVVCIVVEPEEEVAWHRLAQTFCRIACLADCPDWVPNLFDRQASELSTLKVLKLGGPGRAISISVL